MKARFGIVISISLLSALLACTSSQNLPPAPGQIPLSQEERLITILQTNDIHGGVEPSVNRDGTRVGGMALFGGVVRSIKTGIAKEYGDRAGVVVVDAGDQFQGTLISNFNEGQLVFATMNEVGYDAVVPGNHDYDFGPKGWLEDQVTPETEDKSSKGALLRLVGQAKFPLLSANTYLKSSLVTAEGTPVEVDGVGCRPTSVKSKIDWKKAKRPEFLKPFTIKTVAGVRVALVGLDNGKTPSMTAAENVSDLCFRDERESYAELRAELEGKADLFVIVIHNGNSDNEFPVTALVQGLPDGSVDAVVAGHTHYVNKLKVKGVPIIQSASGGKAFGRIDLVYNTNSKKVDSGKTLLAAGVQMYPDSCAPTAREFCSVEGTSAKKVNYEGVSLVSDGRIESLITQARTEIEPIAGRFLGEADDVIFSNRIDESPLANLFSDVLREMAGAEVAFLNTGGLRAPLQKGDVTYEDVFRVLPFNNRAVKIGPMPARQLIAILERSIRTCGSYGALMQSGLKVTFERDCRTATDGMDFKARLLRVETLRGELITADSQRSFQVATLDYLSSGGSGYNGFKGIPILQNMGVMREMMVEHLLKRPVRLTPETDGRWKRQLPDFRSLKNGEDRPAARK